MSIKKISKEQPSDFEFNKKNLAEAQKIINNYPDGKQQSAVMPLLYLAQKQNDNWIPLVAMKYIAKFLKMPYIKVYEVATFYTMYNLSPVGKYFFQVCTTTPCMIRGAYYIVNICKKEISDKEFIEGGTQLLNFNVKDGEQLFVLKIPVMNFLNPYQVYFTENDDTSLDHID